MAFAPAWRVFRAARPSKLVPLALLVVAGTLVTPGSLRLQALGIASVGLLAASFAAMHINVFTDIELDREHKPELWDWLAQNRRFSLWAIGVELAVFVSAGVLLVASREPAVAGFVTAYGMMGALYSFNFLCPRRPRATRLKVHWLGHMVAMQTVYVSAWLVGLSCTATFDAGVAMHWIPAFALIALCDYGLFLAESGLDAEDERRAGLRTLAALVGTQGSIRFGLILAGIGALGLVLRGVDSTVVMVAFVPAAAATVFVLGALLRAPGSRRGRIIDAAFAANRVYVVAALFALGTLR